MGQEVQAQIQLKPPYYADQTAHRALGKFVTVPPGPTNGYRGARKRVEELTPEDMVLLDGARSAPGPG